jgi:hypothetical protein
MILPDQKTIFIHIPKTGGQSVSFYLLKNLGVKNYFALKQPKYGLILNKKLKKQGPSHYAHMFVNEYVNYNFITVKQLELWNKITVVRNPYSRFKSAFYFKNLHETTDYRSWCKQIELLKTDKNSNLYRMFTPQTEYLEYNNKIFVDNIFYTENLKDLFVYFNKEYAFTTETFKKNRTTNRKLPLDKYTIDFINDFYKEDFENFGYERL